MSTPRRGHNRRTAPEDYCLTCNHRRTFHGTALAACAGIGCSCSGWTSPTEPPSDSGDARHGETCGHERSSVCQGDIQVGHWTFTAPEGYRGSITITFRPQD